MHRSTSWRSSFPASCIRIRDRRRATRPQLRCWAWTSAGLQRGRGGPGGWWILDEPELHLHGDVLVPDLAGWRRERMPEQPKTAYYELSPDWVCEVLSPSTARVDRVLKVPSYARERVAHVWLVNPADQTFEVLRLDGESYRLIATHGGSASVRPEPFAAVELELGALWAGSPSTSTE